ncbi:MAG: flagellar M-ring protein FliF, partial [Alphaproteobacteria bacterium]|nr:flagellar M-ring protein FliF [Alphaproteobacteria bacterium]
IKAARVHLGLPERAAFSRERSQASASVIVRTSANTTLSRNHAQSIQALVASAVADLDAQNVTILSASGETILAKEDAGGSDYSLQSQRSTIEEQLAQKVESILNARVGTGNSRVRVSVDLTTERERRVTQSFDPDQQVARSIETRARNSSEADGNAGTVDVGNNIPAELRDANAAGGGQSTRNENDEIINYEIGSVESEMTREPGDIERVSVAVLVNGSYGTLPDGSEGYIERSADEMATLTRLVTTAIGFDENRGDQVQVDSLEFLNYETDFNGMPGRGLGTILADNTMAILRALFALAFAAIVMLFGAKPLRLILDATSPTPALAGAGGDASMLGAPSGSGSRAIGSSAGQDRLPGPAVSQSRELVVAGQEGSREMIQIASVDGGVRQSQIKAAVDLAQEDSDGALRVLGQWLAEKDAR